MCTAKVCSVLAVALLAFAMLMPAAWAGEWNQVTKIHFSQPVAIPGAILPAGTYRFVLLDDNASRDTVQIFSADGSRLYATLDTVPELRSRATSRVEILFAERPHNQPEAVMTWFYPGLFTGHEFLYPSRQEKRLARDAKQDVLAKRMISG